MVIRHVITSFLLDIQDCDWERLGYSSRTCNDVKFEPWRSALHKQNVEAALHVADLHPVGCRNTRHRDIIHPETFFFKQNHHCCLWTSFFWTIYIPTAIEVFSSLLLCSWTNKYSFSLKKKKKYKIIFSISQHKSVPRSNKRSSGSNDGSVFQKITNSYSTHVD